MVFFALSLICACASTDDCKPVATGSDRAVISYIPKRLTLADTLPGFSKHQLSECVTNVILFGLFTPVSGAAPLLISASFGVPALFQKGVLLNGSPKTIVAYRIGWVYGYQDKAPSLMRVNGRTLLSAKSARLIQFFVAEVKFSDGTSWKQHLDKVREIGSADRSQSVAQSLRSFGTTGFD
jgi:hypothetical protein